MSRWTEDDFGLCAYWLDNDEYYNLKYMMATDEEKRAIDQVEKDAAKTGLALLGGLAGVVPKSTEITSELVIIRAYYMRHENYLM